MAEPISDETWINSVALAILAALLGVAGTMYLNRRAATIAANKELSDRIRELETKLALVNQAVVPLNMAMQAMLIKELTHYHAPEMDVLMQNLGPPSTLSESEEARLAVLLDERTREMGPLISPSERDAAAILPVIIKRAKAEAEMLAGAEAMKLRLVTVTAVVGVPVTLDLADGGDKP